MTIRTEYNDAGDVIRESYFDGEGRPMIHEGRVYASREFIDDGQPKNMTEYNTEDLFPKK